MEIGRTRWHPSAPLGETAEMSYTKQLQKLTAVEHDLKEVCLDPDGIDGEVFHRRLAPLLDELYRVHELLCSAPPQLTRPPLCTSKQRPGRSGVAWLTRSP